MKRKKVDTTSAKLPPMPAATSRSGASAPRARLPTSRANRGLRRSGARRAPARSRSAPRAPRPPRCARCCRSRRRPRRRESRPRPGRRRRPGLAAPRQVIGPDHRPSATSKAEPPPMSAKKATSRSMEFPLLRPARARCGRTRADGGRGARSLPAPGAPPSSRRSAPTVGARARRAPDRSCILPTPSLVFVVRIVKPGAGVPAALPEAFERVADARAGVPLQISKLKPSFSSRSYFRRSNR